MNVFSNRDNDIDNDDGDDDDEIILYWGEKNQAL